MPAGHKLYSPSYHIPLGVTASGPLDFGFLHNYKVAGASVRQAFFLEALCNEKACTGQQCTGHNTGCDTYHWYPDTFWGAYLPEWTQRSFTFSFVRNPWDRHVSNFLFLQTYANGMYGKQT